MMRVKTSITIVLLLACGPLSVVAQSAPRPAAASAAPISATPTPTMLPPVSIPATAPTPVAPGAAAPITPATAPTSPLTDMLPATIPASEQPQISLGVSKISVFFSPIQMQAVKEALEDYESNIVRDSNKPKTDLAVDLSQLHTENTAQKIVEPDIYPVFYLSSIAYRSPGDWSIWVSGHKITSHKNTTNLQIVSVTPNQASFAWKPSYADSINTRKNANMLAPIDPVKNKLTNPSAFHHDPATGIITFTLRPNQSFAAAYLNTFEGFIESPKLPEMKPENATSTVSNGAPRPDPNASISRPSTDIRQSPSDLVNTMSISASRREIDAQLQRAEEAKKQKQQPQQ